MQRYERIDGGKTTFAILLAESGAPQLLHFGARLSDGADLAEIASALRSGPRESTPDQPVPPSLYPTGGFGWMGEPAISGVHEGGDGALDWSHCSARREGERLVIALSDTRTGIHVELTYAIDPASGVLSAQARITNRGERTFRLQQAASLCLPLPSWATQVLGFTGDWSREGQPLRAELDIGAWSQTNRTGRTGFGGATFVAIEANASDDAGRAIAVHLAWSGNHRLCVETLPDGQRVAMAGTHLAPGELDLAAGDVYETPVAYAGFSDLGFNGISDAFHPFVRRQILPAAAVAVRRVHFNSWEAAYFDFDEASLIELARAAAGLGVERFVLDDGWFAGRRDDTSSLGDWRVDPDRFADGLTPLINEVHALGMDFGLWVEPEMVSADSNLYRTHPDWCVHAPGAARPTMRNQLWLDMAREEVRDHIHGQLDALLSTNAIAYLKWDCNRFLYPAASGGAPAATRIVRGTYALMDRLKASHPTVEIESCASGGARMDFEILKRASRVWPSDTTDAIERLRIQRWAGLVLPPEVIGAHVGPRPNPITGRDLPMALRARVAMFGHMGVESDPRMLGEEDRQILAAHIELYKRHRKLIHTGRHLRWRTDDGAEAWISVSPSADEALLLACRSEVARYAESAPVRIGGLDRASRYRVRLCPPWPKIASRRLHDPDGWRDGRTFSGEALSEIGLRLPLADPLAAWLVHLERA